VGTILSTCSCGSSPGDQIDDMDGRSGEGMKHKQHG
jgi:hypothetical protein